MTAQLDDGWRTAGCGDGCRPRQHDPLDHEAYGRLLERWETTTREPILTGPLTVDLAARTTRIDGSDEIRLTPREWGVLEYLARRVGQWCPLDAIYTHVWQSPILPPHILRRGTSRRPDHHTVSVTVTRLRQKLGPRAATLLESWPGSVPSRRLRLEPPR